MKRLIVFIFFVVFMSSTGVSAQNQDSIVGEWYTEEGRSIVEIYKCEEQYCGKIVWLKYPKDEEGKDKVDKNNPDEKERSQKLKGLNIMSGFTYKGDNRWGGGKIYDPDNGKSYSCKMSLENNKLKVRGYIGISLFGRTTVWTKKI
jgi:uncharacterized protein (DUF2147 family)